MNTLEKGQKQKESTTALTASHCGSVLVGWEKHIESGLLGRLVKMLELRICLSCEPVGEAEGTEGLAVLHSGNLEAVTGVRGNSHGCASTSRIELVRPEEPLAGRCGAGLISRDMDEVSEPLTVAS